MTKQELINEFVKNHLETISYINELNEHEFNYKKNGKWAAGQQLQHVLLTIKPFPKALSSKEFLLDKFGKIDRPTWGYKTVLENYSKTSLKASERFLPANEISFSQKKEIIAGIQATLKEIESVFNDYSEAELDTLLLPHPLLGKLTIREMFYLMSYHPLHHQKQIEQMFLSKSGSQLEESDDKPQD